MEKCNFKDFTLDMFKNVLNQLSLSRPIFHNEQDFQFELAMKLRDFISDSNIRLEYCNSCGDDEKRQYIDILIINKEWQEGIAIELKYKTKACNNKKKNSFLKLKDSKEKFYLKEQGAKDFGCYYIYKDIKRLEDIIGKKINGDITIVKSFVIFLTNDEKYKDNAMSGIFKNYSLNPDTDNNVIVEKGLHKYLHPQTHNVIDKWDEKFPPSTIGKEPLNFRMRHIGQWFDYKE